ncbi:MAG: aminotransferase class I/II-fold pyridoxal phosphate-dependent enzyme [Planctomycetota bacterium]
MKKRYGLHTRAAQAHLDGQKQNRPLSVPIVQASTFQVESSEQLKQLFRTRAATMYSRFGNPTLREAGARVALLEGAEAGLVFASGMSAITTSLFTRLKPGDHVVAQRDIFAQTFTFLDRFLRGLGVDTTFVDATNLAEVKAARKPNTRLVYVETPSNPLIKIVDLKAIAQIAREQHAALFVDSTFASPALQNPLELGATLVLHSATKFLAGHADLMCGAVAGPRDLIAAIQETQILLGSIQDPHAAWLLLRGMKTLGVRVQRQCENALAIARFLADQDGIARVHYPWLESSPYHRLAREQMRGGGGVLSFEVTSGLRGARAFLQALELIPVATSLGGVETVVEIPAELDFGEDELGEEVKKTGISSALIRLSVGIEDPSDLLDDLKRGVAALRR